MFAGSLVPASNSALLGTSRIISAEACFSTMCSRNQGQTSCGYDLRLIIIGAVIIIFVPIAPPLIEVIIVATIFDAINIIYHYPFYRLCHHHNRHDDDDDDDDDDDKMMMMMMMIR